MEEAMRAAAATINAQPPSISGLVRSSVKSKKIVLKKKSTRRQLDRYYDQKKNFFFLLF